MTNPALSLFTEKSEVVKKLIAENPELADHIEILEKLLKQQTENNKGMSEDNKRQRKTIEQLQAELKYYIGKTPALQKKWNNIKNYKVMTDWFNEYLESKKTKSEIYELIYTRAIEAGYLKEVKHKDEASGFDQKKAIEDKVRKCLNTYRDRHKKATEDRIKKGLHI